MVLAVLQEYTYAMHFFAIQIVLDRKPILINQSWNVKTEINWSNLDD